MNHYPVFYVKEKSCMRQPSYFPHGRGSFIETW